MAQTYITIGVLAFLLGVIVGGRLADWVRADPLPCRYCGTPKALHDADTWGTEHCETYWERRQRRGAS